MASLEEFADAVVATLQTNLQAFLDQQAAKFAAVDAAADRDLSKLMQAPRAEDYHVGGKDPITRWPTIEVAAPDLTLTRYSLEQRDADGLTVLIARASLKHARFDLLYRATNRWGSALSNLLAQPDAFLTADDRPTIETLNARYRWNPETNEKDEVKSAVLLHLTLNTGFVRP